MKYFMSTCEPLEELKWFYYCVPAISSFRFCSALILLSLGTERMLDADEDAGNLNPPDPTVLDQVSSIV